MDTIQRLRLTEDISDQASEAGARMLALIHELFPLPRSITGEGLRATVRRIDRLIGLNITEVPSGTPVFDWAVPNEWSIDDAYIEHESGQRFASFSESNLHVVGYSTPIDVTLSLDELRPHLHSLPDYPDWVPYRNSFYTPAWGFCLADRVLQNLPAGRYRAVIRSAIKPGSITLAEHVHKGASDDEILIFTHDCHPSLANDNLSGVVVATYLADFLRDKNTHFTYRFVFAPATIGSITWLALNESRFPKIRHGIVLALLGNKDPLFYKKTRKGNLAIDRAAKLILNSQFSGSHILEFSPWGFDERQFGTPGIDLPVGGLSRSPDATLVENHTSADNPDAICPASLGNAWLACLKIFEALENDIRYVNLQPKGEPQLGRRGLYRATGGYYTGVAEYHMALLWMLNQSDGATSLLDTAAKSGLSISLLAAAAEVLVRIGLLRELP